METGKVVKRLNAALEHIYTLLGVDSSTHIELTACQAESTAQVLYNAHFSSPKDKVRVGISPCAMAPVQLTVDRIGEHHEIPLSEHGQITLPAIEAAIDHGLDLISLSYANDLTGVIHPIEEIARLCMDRGVLLHVDATPALGRLYFKLADLPIDYLTLDRAVFIKEGAPFKPLILGKASPTPESLETWANDLDTQFINFDTLNLETARLRSYFEEAIVAGQPLFQEAYRLPNVTCITFPGVAAETLLYALQDARIPASLGGGTYPKLSHMLKKSHLDPALAFSALSFTLTTETTKETLGTWIAAITAAYLSLKKTASALMEDTP